MYSDKPKRAIFKIICLGLSLLLIFSHLLLPQEVFASRSNAGGGDLAEFDFGKLTGSVGTSLGSMAIGSAITSGLRNAYGQMTGQLAGQSPGIWSAMGDSLVKSFNFDNMMISGLSTFSATSQVGRAVGMLGNYYGWSPSTSIIISNTASGLSGGFLNPSITLGEAIPTNVSLDSEPAQLAYYTSLPTMAKGALVGGLVGLASSSALVAIGGDRINAREEPGIGAQIAGLVVGVAAGNFSRAWVNPATWNETSLGVIRQEKNPESRVYEDLAQRQIALAENLALEAQVNPYLVLDAPLTEAIARAGSYTEMAQQNITLMATGGPGRIEWRPLSEREISQLQKPEIKFRPRGNGVFEVVQTQAPVGTQDIRRRLLEATFIKTADMWPQLATRALSLVATDSLGKDNRQFAPLVSSVVEGLATPFLSNVAEYYALKPGLYIGENRIANRIEHINNIYQAAYQVPLNKVGEKARDLSKEYKGILANIPNEEDPEYKEYEIKRNEYLNKLQQVFKAEGIDIDLSTLVDRLSILKYSLNAMKESDMKKEEMESRLKLIEDLAKQDLATAILGAAMSKANIVLQVRMKDDIAKGRTLEEVLETTKANRFSLFWNSATREMKFGLVEGAVSGGTSYLTSQLSKNDPLAGAAGAYAASMLTGAIRGVLWHTEWERSRQNGELVWMDRYSLFKPEPYKGDDWFQQKVSEYTYPRELETFNKFGRFFGEEPRLRTKTEYTIGPLGETEKKEVPVPGYELVFKDPRPDLNIAVLVSLAQTNREFLNRTFSFGAPQTRPENINTLMLSDYLGQLNAYALSGSRADWFTSGLSSGMLSAGSSAMSNNLLTSWAAIKSRADALGMQRQRLVLTNSPLTGVTIQSLDYKPWALGLETRFYLPFPNDVYRAKSRTGKSFIKE